MMGFGIGFFIIGVSAIGAASNALQRLLRYLPSRWFPTLQGTRIYATLVGFSTAFDQIYSQLSYVQLQARIKTATDGFLDLISWDFFQGRLPRRSGETDTAFRARILPNILRPRVTRQGMSVTLRTLTGRTPKLFEPIRSADAGALDAAYLGFDMAGGFTDYTLFPYQMLIVAYLGNGAQASDIYSAVNAAKPEGTVAWVAILPNAVRLMDAANSQFIPCIGRF